MSDSTKNKADGPSSSWGPFRHSSFTILWIATVLSNVGTWMHDVGAGWLMVELSSSPALIAGVQAATTLPVFLFALLAGAVADIVDRRWMLIVVNLLTASVAAILAVLVYAQMVTPTILILFTFLIGTGAAFSAPAWQAIVPSLVPRSDLPSAIALNSAGINVSRAIGPALAGVLIVALGVWTPFALNALSFVGIIAALVWWRQEKSADPHFPPERVASAIVGGWRYVANSPPVRATLIRAGAFFLFASAYWAMLPLVASQTLSGGPTLYGLLMGSVGTGAVVGAFFMTAIKKRLGPNWTVAAGTLGTAFVLVVLATQKSQPVAIAAAALAGFSWIAVLSSLNVSAQTSLPDWVRARGLSFFLTIFFGSMSLGSLVWGQVASFASVEMALLIAAAGIIVMVPLSWRAKLNQAEEMDLAASMHWPEPILSAQHAEDRGPVMIQVRYHVSDANKGEFLDLIRELSAARRRSGGYGWSIMQNAENPDQYLESWFEGSWTAHLRHHERVTGEDKLLQERILTLLDEGETPQVAHFLGSSHKTNTTRDR